MKKYLKYILIGGVFVVAYIFFAKWAKKKNLFKIGKTDDQNTTEV